MGEKIKDLTEFRKWVKKALIDRDMTATELAARMGVKKPRISEAIHGKPGGRRHIIPIIKALGGDPEDFQEFLKAV